MIRKIKRNDPLNGGHTLITDEEKLIYELIA